MTNSDIAVILTAFKRPELLKRSLESVLKYLPNALTIIIDQGDFDDCQVSIKIVNELQSQYKGLIKYLQVNINAGLSLSRNEGIKEASKLGYKYCIISADSIEFTEETKDINILCNLLDSSIREEWSGYDIIGLDLKNRKIGWEANLELIKGKYFELEFIDKESRPEITIIDNSISTINGTIITETELIPIWKCDIVRNFFIARIESLLEVPWDNNLLLCEHEDKFWRGKFVKQIVGWTNLFSGNYIGERTEEYTKIRNKNWNKSQKLLKEKWGITGWVNYKHLERAKE